MKLIRKVVTEAAGARLVKAEMAGVEATQVVLRTML